MVKIGLLNYGAGNFASVLNALSHLELDVEEVTAPSDLDSATHIILPGVGSFPAAVEKLDDLGLVDALREHVLGQRKPFLGICVGMQILASEGREFRTAAGLDYVPGVVDRIASGDSQLRIPHMGWNELTLRRSCPLFAHIEDSPSFYFVHSYCYTTDSSESVVATCEYGQPITACIQAGNVFGVQFHPEKSQRDGLQLLRNFSQLDPTNLSLLN